MHSPVGSADPYSRELVHEVVAWLRPYEPRSPRDRLQRQKHPSYYGTCYELALSHPSCLSAAYAAILRGEGDYLGFCYIHVAVAAVPDVRVEDVRVRETDAQVEVVQLLEGLQGGSESYLLEDLWLVRSDKGGQFYHATDSSWTLEYISGMGEWTAHVDDSSRQLQQQDFSSRSRTVMSRVSKAGQRAAIRPSICVSIRGKQTSRKTVREGGRNLMKSSAR